MTNDTPENDTPEIKPSQPKFTVADIFNLYMDDYLESHNIPCPFGKHV